MEVDGKDKDMGKMIMSRYSIDSNILIMFNRSYRYFSKKDAPTPPRQRTPRG